MENAAPEGRGGHSLFANENKLYVYGGWNSEMQYNNLCVFDLDCCFLFSSGPYNF